MINITYEYALACCESLFNSEHTTICDTNPCFWGSRGLNVVGDGYIPECGTRIHIVKEKLEVSPVMIDNAIVFTLETGE